MKIVIKYFGLIIDVTNQKEEIFESTFDEISTEQLKDILIQKYPQLEKITYKTAVNEVIVSENTILQNSDTIALLPPFAGG